MSLLRYLDLSGRKSFITFIFFIAFLQEISLKYTLSSIKVKFPFGFLEFQHNHGELKAYIYEVSKYSPNG